MTPEERLREPCPHGIEPMDKRDCYTCQVEVVRTAVAAEREECAKVCEEYATEFAPQFEQESWTAGECAVRIRDRSTDTMTPGRGE